jgi:DinB superfamily
METVELAAHLVGLVPAECLDWQPIVPGREIVATDLGHLLGHLLDCLAGFCAAMYTAFPEHLSDFVALHSLTVNHLCTPEEAKSRIQAYSTRMARGFDHCTDEDLGRKLPTVFVPEGELLMTILLGNLEHLMNHKYQLFFYLKLLGIPVGTQDLYKLRGAPKGT